MEKISLHENDNPDCSDVKPNSYKNIYESFGENSRCFRGSKNTVSFCFNFKIKGSKLVVPIDGKDYECSYKD